MVGNDTLNYRDILGLAAEGLGGGPTLWGYRERIRLMMWCDCYATVNCVRETPCDVEVFELKYNVSDSQTLDMDLDPFLGFSIIEETISTFRNRIRVSAVRRASTFEIRDLDSIDEDGNIEVSSKCPDGFEGDISSLSVECKCDLIIERHGTIWE
jgi:hypothetical protein